MKITEIDSLIAAAEKELGELKQRQITILKQSEELKKEKAHLAAQSSNKISLDAKPKITNSSSREDKIFLFRSLFRGREDVFPRRFESMKTGKSGYQPACRHEWVRGICKKPAIKCSSCNSRDLIPVTNEIIKNHLQGFDHRDASHRDYTIGAYPLLEDETCWFLAIDFDKQEWMKDVAAFLETAQKYTVPAVCERSRSGQGGHVWIFFSEPIKASLARTLGAFLITETMNQRPEVGLDSYDRFFPSQDTMPQGGFGNLIALPLQKKAREKENSVFVDTYFIPYPDQWAFLASIHLMSTHEVIEIINKASDRVDIIGVRMVDEEEDEILPWRESASRQKKDIPVKGPLPAKIKLILGNQIYIEKEMLLPALRNKLIRIAAFQNPEFYRKQAMRLPTYDKPRIIHCCEDFPKHIGLPRGCLNEVVELLRGLGITIELIDERLEGKRIRCEFKGILRPDQTDAAEKMLQYDTGVLSASTAFGKTVVGIYLIARRKVNTLILVHRRQLLDQWIARLKTFLEIAPDHIGYIGSGKRKESKVIDVALIQSLSQKGVVDDVVGEYGHLIVDECHHISAPSFEAIARQCKAKYVAGLSATVTRKDGHHPIIFMHCGPLRYKVDDRKQAAERPFTHKAITRKTTFRLPDILSGSALPLMNEIYTALMSDKNRNDMIVEDVIHAVKAGRFPVILTERKEHIEILSGLLTPYIKNIFVMKGGMGQKQRQALADTMQLTPDSEEKVIIATGRYLGEGFDNAQLDTLFLTLPVSWRGTLAQYAGRLHRLYDTKKEVIIYDYVDLEVTVLAKMFRKRLSVYKAIGYEVS